MRNESRMIAEAFRDRKPAKAARTFTDGESVYLHHNKIAWRNADGSMSLTLAGWATPTTRDRLNAICDVMYGTRPFHQKKNVQYHSATQITANNIITYHDITMVDPDEYWSRRCA